MPSNTGSQSISQIFYNSLTSINLNQIAKDIRKVGIYSGGYLSKNGASNTEAIISTFAMEISDGTYQIRCQSASAITVSGVSSTNCYIVARWVYTGSATNDYVGFYAVSFANIQANDVIVGKCVYITTTLSSFDYGFDTTNKIWNRTNPNVQDLFLKVEPNTVTPMAPMVRGGRVNYGSVGYDIGDQAISTITAPSTVGWSRIDLVQISEAGAVTVTTGDASASPVAPDYKGLITLAEITTIYGQTSITASSIKDVRGVIGEGKFTDISSSCTTNGWSSNTIKVMARRSGNMAFISYEITGNADNADTILYIPSTWQISANATMQFAVVGGIYTDGSWQAGLTYINKVWPTSIYFRKLDQTNLTASGTKNVYGQIFYQLA